MALSSTTRPRTRGPVSICGPAVSSCGQRLGRTSRAWASRALSTNLFRLTFCQLKSQLILVKRQQMARAPTYDEGKVEEAVLALLYFGSFERPGARCAWKTYEWGIT